MSMEEGQSKARTVTESGNVIYQRTPRGWTGSLGLWPLALPISIILVASTWPPQAPYFDTAVYGLLVLISGWRVLRASRQMVVALGDKHMQYIGMGRAWYFYFKDLDGVDLADEVTMFSLPLPVRRSRQDAIPRYLLFTMRNGNRVNVRLAWFDGAALLADIDARLPGKIKRSERYRETMRALKAR